MLEAALVTGMLVLRTFRSESRKLGVRNEHPCADSDAANVPKFDLAPNCCPADAETFSDF